jgi:predicted DNA-binding transcriptional regulator AlpA
MSEVFDARDRFGDADSNTQDAAGEPPRPLTPEDPLLTPEEVSRMLGGVAVGTLKRWRVRRQGPCPVHIGRLVMYRYSAVEAWLEEKDREAAVWMAT